ncbi:potassium channel family protein [Aegicerativicinus sediminis]|uniref:potassium channel family protein n=1 Tax=Aegicerativicinus sediminis TaxID=2893202 RepID=UPI001E3DBF80|nr:potassium channel family protein [Aegicerativicinus sediminis]
MKSQPTILILFLLLPIICYSQETSFKEYSYSQFFEMIEAEQDSIFKLKDAIIKYNGKTDSLRTTYKASFQDPIPIHNPEEKYIIDKVIDLENVHFTTKFQRRVKDSIDSSNIFFRSGALINLHFKKRVFFRNVAGSSIFNCVFDDAFFLGYGELCNYDRDFWNRKDINIQRNPDIGKNIFDKGISFASGRCPKNDEIGLGLSIFKNRIYSPKTTFGETNYGTRINSDNLSHFVINENTFTGEGTVGFYAENYETYTLVKNSYESPKTEIALTGEHDALVIKENSFKRGVSLSLNNIKSSDLIEWKQFKNNIISFNAFQNYVSLLPDEEYYETFTDSFTTLYKEKLRYQNAEIYGGEAALRGVLYKHYRENFDMVSANEVFMNLKDFETQRLEYIFNSNPSFDTFFTWKVNQFLKEFSNYGTKPSKAITFSVYVIFFFAIIYLFFPNSWDRHGRKRILNRYSFFIKYMRRDMGIHEVYLEDMQPELLEYEEYKNLVQSSDKAIPKFFSITALPMYRWAVSGTKLYASFLRKIDIMKGTWQELPSHKRFGKSILLTGAFFISLIYDLFIKVLNALMLSINTFTTLGFGEIPIKGLPRYLAIIQGFIGWFMLTIFSVSLISQLLN